MATAYQGSATGVLSGDPGAYSASTVYALNAKVRPSTPNGLWYQLTTAKSLAAAEPTWPLVVGNTVTDASGNVWTCEGDFPSIGVAPAITLPVAGDNFNPQSFALPLEQLADFVAFLQGYGPFKPPISSNASYPGSGNTDAFHTYFAIPGSSVFQVFVIQLAATTYAAGETDITIQLPYTFGTATKLAFCSLAITPGIDLAITGSHALGASSAQVSLYNGTGSTTGSIALQLNLFVVGS